MKIKVMAKPNSKQRKIEELSDGSLIVHLKCIPQSEEKLITDQRY